MEMNGGDFIYTSLDPHTDLPFEVSCVAHISECHATPDGRLLITGRGKERVRILEHAEIDGYRIAKYEKMEDKEEGDKGEEEEAINKSLVALELYKTHLEHLSLSGIYLPFSLSLSFLTHSNPQREAAAFYRWPRHSPTSSPPTRLSTPSLSSPSPSPLKQTCNKPSRWRTS